jgi:hypothetical protein
MQSSNILRKPHLKCDLGAGWFSLCEFDSLCILKYQASLKFLLPKSFSLHNHHIYVRSPCNSTSFTAQRLRNTRVVIIAGQVLYTSQYTVLDTYLICLDSPKSCATTEVNILYWPPPRICSHSCAFGNVTR